MPDGTTLLKFRRKLRDNGLGEQLFAAVGQVLGRGLKLGTGTIVDATIIGAPSSTKNADKARDPEMHQTRKGQQWYFGMKLHIGVDSRTGLVHSAVVTAANVHRTSTRCPICCTAPSGASMATAPTPARSRLSSPGHRPRTSPTSAHAGAGHIDEAVRAKNRTKSQVRARVEHVFGVVKRLWGSTKCATAAWPRTPRARLWRWLWPTSSSREDHCMDRCVHSARQAANGSRRGRKGLGKWRNARQNRTAAPEIPPNRASRARSLLDGALAATCSALP